MLEKKYRLTRFSLKNSKQIKTKYFSLKFSKNEEDLSRFAFVVSKKIDSRATARNQVRRKVRAGIESLQGQIKTGYDFIFYPNREALEVDSKEILGEIEKVFQKESLIK